jgi:hypothetical protein
VNGYDGPVRAAHPILATVLLFGVGCPRPVAPLPPPPPPPEPAPIVVPSPALPPAIDRSQYAFDEALADVLAGPLTHIGTGDWYGLARFHACAYRNHRVIVVNLYCSPREISSFAVVVLSPDRGRAFLYAEARAPISTLRRADYFTFKGETSPAQVDAEVPALELGVSLDQLRAWDERRYRAYQPGCFGGVESGRPQGGCLQAMRDQAPAWLERNQPLLADPPEAWYQVVRLLRGRATMEGKEPRRR